MAEEAGEQPLTNENFELEWHKSVPTLIDRAFEARKHAVSHRAIPFLVGVSGLVWDPRARRFGILEGANYKPFPGSEGPRICGEEDVEKAAELSELQIVGMVIVAQHQPDDETGIDLGVTPSCAFCRRRWHEKHKHISGKPYCVSPDTYLLFVNADIPTARVAMTVRRAMEIFNGVK